jgi:hypothetical protein
VTEYRAYTVDADGHFDGFEPMICDNDDDAIANACSTGETLSFGAGRGSLFG